jgi:hypothetical protein
MNDSMQGTAKEHNKGILKMKKDSVHGKSHKFAAIRPPTLATVLKHHPQ